MHNKYAKDGLACMTVDVSDKELKKQDKVVDFLQKQGAEFPNFILTDGDMAVKAWQRKNGVEVTPGVLLYDRAGRQVDRAVADAEPNIVAHKDDVGDGEVKDAAGGQAEQQGQRADNAYGQRHGLVVQTSAQLSPALLLVQDDDDLAALLEVA